MADKKFDYKAAIDSGYTDEEITSFLSEQYPQFNFKAAQESGYSPSEINQFVSDYKPEKGFLQKAGRVGAQVALGAAEMAAWPYEVAAATVSSKPAQTLMYRQQVMEDIERIQDLKDKGLATDWDLELLPDLIEQIKDYSKSEQYSAAPDVGIRSLAEKATGLNLHPEGAVEKGASWLGMLKNPNKWKELTKVGLNPKKVMEGLGVTGTDLIRSSAAGTALQMAEEGNYGPLGTMGAAVMADVMGHGPKAILNVAKNPKKALAEATNLLTQQNSKKEWVKQIIEDANNAGIQLDAGTLTDSNLIRMMQARASQSALSGKALENFQKNLSDQFVREYQGVLENLGNVAYDNNYQAAEAIKGFLKSEENNLFGAYGPRESPESRSLKGRIAVEAEPQYQQELLNKISPSEVESTYQGGQNLKTVAEDIKAPIKEEFNQRWENLNQAIREIPPGPQPQLANVLDAFVNENRGSLLMGESAAEHRVLQAATRLRDGMMTQEGGFIGVSLDNLIKTKRTLGDVANFEFGGSNFESQYKQLVRQIDQAIETSLERINPELRQTYEALNADYSAFKDMFENKNVISLFEPKNENYVSIYNQFARDPDKLRSLEDIMYHSPRGEEMVNQVKRDYAQRIIQNPNASQRELRDLVSVLGPESQGAVQEYMIARDAAQQRKLPRPERKTSFGATVPIPEAKATKALDVGRIKTAASHERQKLFEYLSKKSPDQIMAQMDTVQGIKKIKNALNLTSEGKELFNKLSRYKLSEMIDKKMMDRLGENIRLGKFSSILDTTKSQAIVKELVGDEAFKQIRLLQKNASRVASSADKFYNASKSGTTIVDVATVGSLMTGIFTGNPYMVMTAGANIGGIQLASRLLSDARFLKYLEQAILTGSDKKFLKLLENMKPIVQDAILKTSLEAQEY